MLSLFRSPLRNAVITPFRKTIPFFAKMSTSSNSKPNRLIHEKSPYLLQHAYNPVDWHPWNVEAFTKAKELNRPIFLSVGYSTCHWCHVMEHESFENEELAKIMNENFINIKVDREERPDVDKLYMSFVQAMTGGGGWPMSVFLTPDLKPITGGTYFPPVDQYGRPGFGTILTMISNQWKKNEAKVKDQGVALADAIKDGLKPKKSNAPSAEFVLNSSSGHLVESFDEARGGFGGAPKFPKPVDLDFLLYYYTQDKKSEKSIYALQMVEKTLQAMAMGGIHDHVGKGFHRYSVDANWHVPHFEKMLYDQGQLLYVYASFHKLTGKFKEIVEDIADYVKENLTHPEGGFYSAEDADSLPTHDSTKKREGAFCVWTKEEIDELLEDRPCRYNENITLAELFETYYEVGENGNVPPYTDPHDELKNQNVLIAKVEHGKRATEFKMSPEKLSVCLEDAKKILRERRALRPKPHLDSKCLTSWNALMISGYASAATAIPERKEFLESAERAIAFIRKYLVDDSGALLRSVYTGDNKEVVQIKEPIRGFADDYVFLIQALLDLYEVNFDEFLLQWALELQARLDELFWDTEHQSGYYMSRKDDASIFARMQEDQDGAEPATNSVASLNLVRMADLFDIPDYRKKAAEIFAGAGARLQKYPYILNKMLIGVNRFAKSPQQIIVVGSGKDEVVQEFLSLIKKKYLPDKTLAFVDLDTRETSFLLEKNKHLKELMSAVQKPTVFICENFACGLPISSADELGKRLETL